MECPYIEKNIILEEINKPINYKDFGGKVDYVFYDHTDPHGDITRVQFCKRVGRKKDVFECLNKNEWRNCHAFSEPGNHPKTTLDFTRS